MRKAKNLAAKPLDDLGPGFCCWLAGLVDGEGCFQVKHQENSGRRRLYRRWQIELTISLRDDDRPMLEMIRKELGRGSSYPHARATNPQHPNSKPRHMLRFDNALDTRFIVALFERYPLRSKKRREFELWARARNEFNKPVLARDEKYLRYLSQAIRNLKKYEESVIEPYEPSGKQLTLAIQKGGNHGS